MREDLINFILKADCGTRLTDLPIACGRKWAVVKKLEQQQDLLKYFETLKVFDNQSAREKMNEWERNMKELECIPLQEDLAKKFNCIIDGMKVVVKNIKDEKLRIQFLGNVNLS